jgi:mRNA-degrading endonuclease RelE of RelBE toxin-antitoxin system
MNKIDKFLNRLSNKERDFVDECLKSIRNKNFEGLNFKKLSGFEGLYRVRKSGVRIIFSWVGQEINILKIDRKNDNTYKNL